MRLLLYLVFSALALAADITSGGDGHIIVEKRLCLSETFATG